MYVEPLSRMIKRLKADQGLCTNAKESPFSSFSTPFELMCLNMSVSTQLQGEGIFCICFRARQGSQKTEQILGYNFKPSHKVRFEMFRVGPICSCSRQDSIVLHIQGTEDMTYSCLVFFSGCHC